MLGGRGVGKLTGVRQKVAALAAGGGGGCIVETGHCTRTNPDGDGVTLQEKDVSRTRSVKIL
jgi:hypothetical protein